MFSQSLKLELKRPPFGIHITLKHMLPRITVILSYNPACRGHVSESYPSRAGIFLISYTVELPPQCSNSLQKTLMQELSISSSGASPSLEKAIPFIFGPLVTPGDASWMVNAHYILFPEEMIYILNVHTIPKTETYVFHVIVKVFQSQFPLL